MSKPDPTSDPDPGVPTAGGAPLRPPPVVSAERVWGEGRQRTTRQRLTRWFILWVSLFTVLRFGLGPAQVWTAAEVDALGAGSRFAESMADMGAFDGGAERGLKQRLKEAFRSPDDHVRATYLYGDQHERRAVVSPPAATWVAGLSIMAPGRRDTPHHGRTATGSALAFALAITLLVAGLWHRGAVVAVAAGLLLALGPGALQAAGGGGYGAAGALASVIFVVGVLRLSTGQRWGVPVTTAGWTFTMAVHPGALFLLVPVFVAYAIGRGVANAGPSGHLVKDPARPGELRLPGAPLGLFAMPVVGIALLIVVWPALWQETGRGLAAWLLDNGWIFNPPYDIAGRVWDQGTNRAAPGFTPWLQWAAWSGPTVVGAFALGVGRLVKEGRAGLWAPLLAWLTLMLVGMTDGGLIGGRLNLMALLWVPSACLAALGIESLGTMPWLRGLAQQRAMLVAGALVLLWPAVDALTPAELRSTEGTGLELSWPAPMAWFADLALADPGAVVRILPETAYWRPALVAARDQLELDVGLAGRAEWTVVVGRLSDEEALERAGGGRVVRRGEPGGVPMQLIHHAGP